MSYPDPLLMSAVPLALKMRAPGRNNPALATGFIAIASDGPMLVTNWHVVKGVDPITGDLLDNEPSPTEVAIHYSDQDTLAPGAVARVEPLYDRKGRARWREHPYYGKRVDVVALPLTEVGRARWHPLDIEPRELPMLVPGDAISVVGFPFGYSAQGFAIWNTGAIATDLSNDYDDLPCFLIDSRTRPGQSGSPVVARRNAELVRYVDRIETVSGPVQWFVGVYAGRVHKDSDLGRVWKGEEVRAVVQRGVRSEELHPTEPPPLDDEER